MHVSWQQINQINLNTTTNSGARVIWPMIHIFIKKERYISEPISSCLLSNGAITLTACQVVLPALRRRRAEGSVWTSDFRVAQKILCMSRDKNWSWSRDNLARLTTFSDKAILNMQN